MTKTGTSNWLRGNVLGLVAIFIALGGTAYATHPGGANTISSGDIINGEVRNGDIGNLEVRANNIAPDSLGGGKIANQSVKNADLSTGASSSNTIADGGIQGVDVKANTLTGTQIDELALDFAVLQQRVADACPAGEAIRAVAQNGTVTCEGVGAAGSFWSLSGNSGTTGTDFLGTTDSNPLNLRVNDARALRLEPASDGTNQSPNVIGGIADNAVTAGVHSATIAGGGRDTAADPATANRVTDHQGTVGGGANNQAGDGFGTVSDRPLATVGGGEENRASGGASTVAGGQFNTAAVLRSFVGGGIDNFAGGGEGATISGGRRNIVGAAAGTVAGGSDNTASGFASTVGGGDDNTANGNRATVPGGTENTALGFVSLAAGRGAQADHDGAFVWADSNNFDFASSALNQFNVRSTGGARLVSGIDGSGNPTSGLELPAGTSGWSALVNGQPFDLRVNGARGFRIDPATDGTNQSPNVIGGIADNSVTAGAHSATIAGGGRSTPANPGSANAVTDNQGTVGGGANNQAGDGDATLTDAAGATVGGGESNTASGDRSTVGGGRLNVAGGAAATVPGGEFNAALGDFSLAAGRGAHADHQGAFVWADSTPLNFASTAEDQFNVRSTGGARLVSGTDGSGTPTSGLELPAGTSGWSTLANGQPFDVRVNGARGLRIEPASDGTNQSPNVIGGIADNAVTPGAFAATIGGGGRQTAALPANRVTDSFGTVGGGAGNQAGDGAGTTSDRRFTTVGGGVLNTASGNLATVGGGTSNTASGQDATVGGGGGNTAAAFVATVPGGQSNSAMGDYSLAAGRRAKANHQGAFVWADSQFSDMASTANNQFIARAAPGFFLTSNSVLPEDQGLINTSAGADASGQNGAFLSSAGVWTDVSDENAKEGFAAVEPNEVLAKLADLPVRSWQYKAEPGVRHIGPVAQDFHRAFGLGADDRHIASLDTSGVALAAIKGLNATVRSQERRIAGLEARLAELERAVGSHPDRR